MTNTNNSEIISHTPDYLSNDPEVNPFLKFNWYHTEEIIQGLFEGSTATTYDWINTKRSTGELKPLILKRYKRNWLYDKDEVYACIQNSREG